MMKPDGKKRPEVLPEMNNSPEKEKPNLRGRLGKVFMRPNGSLRPGWFVIGALIIVRILGLGVRLGLNSGFYALFSAWRVNASNIHLAPRWAQLIYSWHGSFVTLAVCAVLTAVSLFMRRRRLGSAAHLRTDFRNGLVPGIFSGLFTLCSGAVFLIMDSMRPEWPITQPYFDLNLLFMLPVTVFTALSEELFTKGVVFDGVRQVWKRPAAIAATAAVFFVLNGGYAGSILCGINVLLMGIVCCMLYERRGLWAAVLFRGIWSYCSVFVAGFGQKSMSVYSLYSVSEAWLTGGDSGMICGLWMTFWLASIAVWMERRKVPVLWSMISKCVSKKRKQNKMQ